MTQPSSAETAYVPGRSAWRPFKRAVDRPRAAMALWGLLAAVLATLVLLTITPAAWPTRDGRGEKLHDSMTVLEHGGPLLLSRHGSRGQLYAADFGDDAGVYVYVPVLSRLFGVADPTRMLRDVYVALVALMIAFYPLIFHRLTGSLLAGFAAPLIGLVCILAMGFVDIYWVAAWGALVLLPLVFLLARDWSRFAFVGLVGIVFLAGWLSSIRSYSGLGIAIAAAIVLVMRRWRWWRLLPALALLAIVYVSINTFVFTAIRADRDHWLGSAARTLDVTSSHTLWHTVYAGLGYLPNRYSLGFLDGVPLAVVQREAPGTPFLSAHYETVVRDAYLRFASDHPVEVIRQYAAKALVTIADLTPWSLIALLTLPAVLLVGPERRVVRRWMLLTIPAVVVAFLPVMAALPELSYEQGLYGVVGLVGVTGICLLLARVQEGVRESGGVGAMLAGAHLSWGALVHSRLAGWRAARASALAVVLLIVLAFGGYFVRREADHWRNNSSSGVLMEYLG
jgi:hypothetical protein